MATASTADAPPWSRVRQPVAGAPEAVGAPAAGCLVGARALPFEALGFRVVRTSRHRYFGHPALVAYLERLGQDASDAGLPVLTIGDLAQPRGGPMPGGHASHQTGLDVDIAFDLDPSPARSAAARESWQHTTIVAPDNFDVDPARFRPEHVRLLRLAVEPETVERVFVHPAIKRALCARDDRSWLQRIRPWYGHDAHFHVRLRCPAGSPACVPGETLPPGDGCDASLDWWFALDEGILPARREVDPSPTRRPGKPLAAVERPARCAAVLDAP